MFAVIELTCVSYPKNYLKNDCFLRKLLNEVEVLLESAAGRHVMDASL